MSFRRVGWVAAIALATLLQISCGQVYRPVVIPINTTPPNPGNFHAVFGISANVPFNPGTALQIDVSGDTNIGVANMGVNPTHAAVNPNNSQVFVVSAGSLFAGNVDVITSFTPAFDSSIASGLGNPTTFSLPNVGPDQASGITGISEDNTGLVTVTLSAPLVKAQVGATIIIAGVVVTGKSPSGYDGSFTISSVNGTTIQYTDSITGLPNAGAGGTATIPVPLFCSFLPDFITTAQNTAAYVANYGVDNDPNCNLSSTDSVAALNTGQNTVTNIAYLPAGAHPVALAETPDALNLYVVNQGNNTVTDLSPLDLSNVCPLSAPPCPINAGIMPTWAVSRVDGRRVYVVSYGDGKLYTIHTDTNVVDPTSQSVGGAGANFVLYDKSRNRLYATNPGAGAVYAFDATTDPPTPLPLGTKTGGSVSLPPPPPCAGVPSPCSPVMPVSVTALPDGSRFYVASYAVATGSACPDPTVTSSGCIIPQVSVFDAASLTLKTTVFPLLPPASGVQSFALAPVPFCATTNPYDPTKGKARFRMTAAAAADSSRVYASICDGGSIAIINTTTSTLSSGANNTPDTLVIDLPTPFGAGPPQANGEPLPQSPVFLLTGQ